MAGRHEQAIALGPAEADIGGALRQRDEADWLAFGIEDLDAVDFDKATLDPQTGGLKPEFVPDSTIGGAGDKLHPNRAGYLAMGVTIDLDLFRPKQQTRR